MKTKPIYIPWDSFGVCAIAGKTRSGKSSTARLLLSQMALDNVSIIIADAHGNMDEGLVNAALPLEKSFLLPPAKDVDSIFNAIKFINKIKQDRIDGLDPRRSKIALIIDEFTSFILRCTPTQVAFIADLLLSLTNEAAKTNVRVFVIAHNWAQDYIAAAAIRKSINCGLLHRLDENETKLLLPSAPTILKKQIANLKQGKAILYTQSIDPTLVSIPYVTKDDLLSIQDQVSDRSKDREYYTQAKKVINVEDHSMDIKEFIKTARELKSQGKGKGAIIAQLFNVKAGGSDKYKAASKLYDELVRRGAL